RIGGRQRVGGAQNEVGAARLESDRQVGGLRRDVQAGGQPLALERLLALEAFADGLKDGHLLRGPLDHAPAVLGEFEVLNVVPLRRNGGHSYCARDPLREIMSTRVLNRSSI